MSEAKFDEEQLRQGLHTAVGDVDASHGFIVATATKGRRVRQQGRRRLATASAAGAALTILAGAVMAVSFRPNEVSTARQGPVTSTLGQLSEVLEPYIWAQSLPLGPGPSFGFVSEGVLQTPSGQRISMPSSVQGVRGQTPNGNWLVDYWDQSTGQSGLGLISASQGRMTLLPSHDGADQVQGIAIEPGGRRVAYGSAIVDAADGALVGQLPSGAQEVVVWTPAGVVYKTAAGDLRLWTLSGESTQLDPQVVPDEFGNAMQVDGDCVQVQHLSAESLSYRSVGTVCGRNIVSVSPSGAAALDENGAVLNVGGGDILGKFTLPDGWYRSALPIPVFWESDSRFLVEVSERHATALVRCDVDSTTCERAGGDVTDEDGFVYLAPPKAT